MEIQGLPDKFFEWLENCPVPWVLFRDADDHIIYLFEKTGDEANGE